jgi:cytochrome c peroxidase
MLALASACATATIASIVAACTSGQDGKQRGAPPPVYSPYPPNELPPDLQSEIDRVNREVDAIEGEALAQWQALASNPGAGMRQIEILGKLELFDKNLSVNRNQACSFCHMPYAGFTGPIPSLNATTAAYPGSVHFRFGKRKPQAYTYSPSYPVLNYDESQQDFYGGNFWDLRATGYLLQSADAEQAQSPPHDEQEMGLPDTACLVYRLSKGAYRPLFEAVWGAQAFEIAWPRDVEGVCSTPGGAAVFAGSATPLGLTKIDRGRANAAYGQYALSITAYERSTDISPFSSKFDAVLSGAAMLSSEEMAGWQLFRGKAVCNTCHLDGTDNNPKPVGTTAAKAPLFTDFTSSNLGVPRNTQNPVYFQRTPDPFGFTPNPAGTAFTDLGVGGFLRGLSGTNPNPAWTPLAPRFDGKMQVSTLRNVDMRPCPPFVKAYMHNGYLKSLKEVVHFYNTRDTLPRCAPGCAGREGQVLAAARGDEQRR